MCIGTTKVACWTYWYPDGTKQWEGDYTDGLMHGVWSHWGKTGKRVYRYDRGKRVVGK